MFLPIEKGLVNHRIETLFTLREGKDSLKSSLYMILPHE